MIKKFTIILITTLTLVVNVNASSDGELLLKKNNPTNVNDCWESIRILNIEEINFTTLIWVQI